MAAQRIRSFELKTPNTLWGWIVGASVLALAAGLAILFFTVFLALLVVGVVAAPILRWQARRRLRRRPSAPFAPSGRPDVVGAPGAPRPPPPRTIDADYEIE